MTSHSTLPNASPWPSSARPALGKSTLLSILAGLDVPTLRHRYRRRHRNLFQLDEDARAAVRARQMGFVFQSFQLLAHLTALENVMLPLELMGRADARTAATECCNVWAWENALALPARDVGRRTTTRGAGPSPFVVKPAVLLADEPTGSLDFATGDKVMELMFAMNREAGTTLVLVTH